MDQYDTAQEKVDALARLRDECSRIVREDLPERSLLLDLYEREINALVSYIDEQLRTAPTIQAERE